MKAKPQPEQSMQEEQICAALNAPWDASAVGDANADHDIYDEDAISPVGRANPRAQQFADLAESLSRQAIRLQGQADSRKRGSLESRNTQSRTRGDWHTR
jgi:hypothetical protein